MKPFIVVSDGFDAPLFEELKKIVRDLGAIVAEHELLPFLSKSISLFLQCLQLF